MTSIDLRHVITVAALLVTYPILRVIYNICFHPLTHIRGPWTWSASRLPFIRALLRGTIVHDFERLHRKYGPILRIAPDEVTFAQPEAWNDIFQIRPGHEQFLKDPIWWNKQPGHPDSLLSAIGIEHHARIRKLLSPAFTPRALRAQEPIVQRYVNLLVERLGERVAEAGNDHENGVQIDIAPWFNYTTFDIFGNLGFGESFDCLQHSRYHPWIALLFNSVKAASYVAAARFYPLIEWVLMKSIPPSLKKMASDHYQQIVDKVQRRLNWELERPDIMSYVIKESGGEKGIPLGEINSTFMILTTAGSETTATTLCGTMNYLVQNKGKMDILVKEVREAFDSGNKITLDALRDLPYLNAVLKEGLRLCPPVPWMLPRRVPSGGDTVCGVWLPGGTPVSIQVYTMYRDPNYFHEATSFIPERWLPEATDAKSPFCNDRRDAVQSFSVGPRACLGQHLAWAELRLILSKLLWTYDFQAIESEKLKWEDLRTFLLVEKKPIEVMMKLRPV